MKRARRPWRAASEPMKPRKAGAMGRSLQGVDKNCSGYLPLVTSHPQHRGAAESGTKLEEFCSAGPADPHMVSIIAVGSGFLVASKYAAEESGQCSTPRLRRRSSFREPYNLCLQATVGVKDIIISGAVAFAHRA